MSVSSVLKAFSDAKNSKPEGAHIELELRYHPSSADEFMSILRRLSSEAATRVVIRTVNLMKSMARFKNAIATQNFDELKGEVVKNGELAFWEKEGLRKFDLGQVGCAISSEKKTDRFDTNSAELYRVKLRLSMELSRFPDWIFDATVAIQITDIRKVQQYRRAMFATGLTAANFVDSIPAISAETGVHISREIEAEFAGDGEPVDVFEVQKYLTTLAGDDTTAYQSAIYSIASLLYPPARAKLFQTSLGMRDLGKSPIGLDKDTYASIRPNITSFYASEKVDGLRAIVRIADTSAEVLTSSLSILTVGPQSAESIYEAEIIGNKHYVYDVLVCAGTELFDLPFAHRIGHIESIVKIMGPTVAVAKQHIPLTSNFCAEIKAIYKGTYPYEIDGVIFTDGTRPYVESVIYKWKPPQHITIDLFTVYSDKHSAYVLFCGMSHNQQRTYRMKRLENYSELFRGKTFGDIYPIQFMPSGELATYSSENKAIERKVCEYSYDLPGRKWVLVKIRTDRDADLARGTFFGNNIHTAMRTWDNIQDPLTLEMLCAIDPDTVHGGAYFHEKGNRYDAMTKFMNWVKRKYYDLCRDVPVAIELAGGRGSSLWKHVANGTKVIIAVDVDDAALATFRDRYNGMRKKQRSNSISSLLTAHMDLNDPAEANLKLIHDLFPFESSRLVVCDLAIHYTCATPSAVSNVVSLASSLTGPGGIFVFSTINGGRLARLLSEEKKIQRYDHDVLKYDVSYVGEVRPDAPITGRVIETLLPFSDGELYPEPLVDFDFLLGKLAAAGFDLVEHVAFSKHLEEYSIDDIAIYDTLSEADMFHISLYDYAILRKR